jgi:hypothetical protein
MENSNKGPNPAIVIAIVCCFCFCFCIISLALLEYTGTVDATEWIPLFRWFTPAPVSPSPSPSPTTEVSSTKISEEEEEEVVTTKPVGVSVSSSVTKGSPVTTSPGPLPLFGIYTIQSVSYASVKDSLSYLNADPTRRPPTPLPTPIDAVNTGNYAYLSSDSDSPYVNQWFIQVDGTGNQNSYNVVSVYRAGSKPENLYKYLSPTTKNSVNDRVAYVDSDKNQASWIIQLTNGSNNIYTIKSVNNGKYLSVDTGTNNESPILKEPKDIKINENQWTLTLVPDPTPSPSPTLET